jgi:hypothetical protein
MIDPTNVNSAILSGFQGLQRASEGITNASVSIAQRSAQNTLNSDGVLGVLENASTQALRNTRNLLPQSADNLTSDLVSLQLNSLNAQASARVVDAADETVGRIIDTLA